jgi:hypothetical protein
MEMAFGIRLSCPGASISENPDERTVREAGNTPFDNPSLIVIPLFFGIL